jgi:hypothetical protein
MKKQGDVPADTVVVSFRAPRQLVEELDKIAQGDQRTRANYIVRTLTQAVTLKPAIDVVGRILPVFVEEVNKDSESIQAEFHCGMMTGARWTIEAFFGKRAIRWVNHKVRQQTKLPMPHTVALAPDGYRLPSRGRASMASAHADPDIVEEAWAGN